MGPIMKNWIQRAARGRRREGGVILLLGCVCMPVVMGMLALSIDLSVMYSVKARLQMACDGAAIAALRSLSLGQTVSAQAASATSVAGNWFKANFSGTFMGTYGTTDPPTVTVVQDPATFITRVTVTASTNVPSYFMKFWNVGASLIPATSEASRRNVVITMVLDRSGSMNTGSYSGQTPCQVMVTAAKQFTGMFQPNRDYIGLVTFAETAYIAQSPTQNFQNVLGYKNAAGNAVGSLDSITCSGGTNTSTGISIGWNENYKIQLPGALNVIVLMTDGQPTAGTYKFVTTTANDPTGIAQSVVSSSSGCKDSSNKAMISSGNMVTKPRNWIYRESNTGTLTPTVSLGANSYTGWSPISGPVGALYADNSSIYGVDPFFTPPGVAYLENIEKDATVNESYGCAFPSTSTPIPDISWVPAFDIFGSASTGYKAGQTTSSIQGATRITVTRSNVNIACFNLADNAANFARTSHNLPSGTLYGGNMMFVVGLGCNGGVDHTLLQRVANDPSASPDNGVTYGAYNGYNTNQPVGTYLFSADASQLSAAFAEIASQILRLSK